MKTNNAKAKPSHYELLLKAFDKAQAALERAITNEKTAKHYLKTADKDSSKSDLKILELEFLRAKYRRKGRKAAFKIAQIRLKQWLKRHEDDNKLYQLSEANEDNANEENSTAENTVEIVTESIAIVAESTPKSKKSSSKKSTTSDKSKNAATEPEDLTLIEGIGAKVNAYLHAAGIDTFAKLAASDFDTLKGILKANRNTISNPSTWAEQAQLVVDGKLGELKTLQIQLKAGRKV